MARVSIRWLGHAGFLITSPGGKTVAVDPWIVDNPLCPLKLDDIGAVDLVLVSHDHFDHTGSAADIVKKTGAILVAPPETAGRFQSEMGIGGDNVVAIATGSLRTKGIVFCIELAL